MSRPHLAGLEGLDLAALTAGPRGYGFHATLKAPFELAAEHSEAELMDFAQGFARDLAPFETSIAPAALGRFLAFRTRDPSPSIEALAAQCVRAFDRFRAPLSAFDLARRRRAPLTPVEDARLVRWGYPYVFDDFRFHMTLTDEIPEDGLRGRLLDALTLHFVEESGPHRFDGLAVFRQADRGAPFDILERFAFAAPVQSATP